jgi:hypothetical protein
MEDVPLIDVIDVRKTGTDRNETEQCRQQDQGKPESRLLSFSHG